MEGAGGVGVIIVAAGASRRMEGQDKVFAPLLGRPLIAYAVEAFLGWARAACVVLVLGGDNLRMGTELARKKGWGTRLSMCQGGPRRRDSVWEGLKALPPCQWVMVHDGARPLVSLEVMEAVLEAGQVTGAAISAVPVKDTVKVVGPQGNIVSTPPRETLWLAQTPQAFRRDLLEEAHRSLEGDFTDDASMVERLGHAVKVAMGSYDNIKVTTPEDLALVEGLLKRPSTTEKVY